MRVIALANIDIQVLHPESIVIIMDADTSYVMSCWGSSTTRLAMPLTVTGIDSAPVPVTGASEGIAVTFVPVDV